MLLLYIIYAEINARDPFKVLFILLDVLFDFNFIISLTFGRLIFCFVNRQSVFYINIIWQLALKIYVLRADSRV
jgi:hypothetical protein